jgi:hypothetical protein
MPRLRQLVDDNVRSNFDQSVAEAAQAAIAKFQSEAARYS